jgi:hypothetical protein
VSVLVCFSEHSSGMLYEKTIFEGFDGVVGHNTGVLNRIVTYS